MTPDQFFAVVLIVLLWVGLILYVFIPRRSDRKRTEKAREQNVTLYAVLEHHEQTGRSWLTPFDMKYPVQAFEESLKALRDPRVMMLTTFSSTNGDDPVPMFTISRPDPHTLEPKQNA